MTHTAAYQERRRLEALDRAAIEKYQLDRLNKLIDTVLPHNDLYAHKLSGVSFPLADLKQIQSLPLTSKDELLPDVGQQFPQNLTFSPTKYTRFHQTSGTRGRPLAVLDTIEDWQWWIDGWQFVLDAADVDHHDRVMLAFSFGPFIGFWSAFEALVERGVMTIPGGGMSSLARLELCKRLQASTLFCTPTYALHLVEVAANNQIKLTELPVEKIVVAGEPGGSIPATQQRIEQAWGATVFDHAGASELGPWGYPNADGTGLHVLEAEFIAEFFAVETGKPSVGGELSHLVLTNLGRYGSPLVRYRTGDLVRPRWPEKDKSNQFVLLEGGVLGRSDDMMIVRGVNVFPSSIEQILHGFPEVVEYRITVRRKAELDELVIELEDRLKQPDRIAEELRLRLGLKVHVHCVPSLSLPRFEGKGKRFIDLRD